MIKVGDIYVGDPRLGRVSHTYGIYLVLKERDKNDRHLCLEFCSKTKFDTAAVYLELCELIASC